MGHSAIHTPPSAFSPSRQRCALLGIILVAFFLRVWQLDQRPPGLYYDEAAHGLDALRIWQGDLYLFFPTEGGHEPLFTYVMAGFVRLLGNDVWAVRLPAAFFGTMAVTACYGLGKEILGRGPALFASGLLAVTFWTVALNRMGYRANTLLVIGPLWLLAYWRCRQRRDLKPYLWAGLLLGLAQYTYLAARFLPLVALVLAVDWRKELSRRGLVVGALVAAVVTLPLALALLTNPDAGGERLRQVWIFSRPEPWALLWQQIQGHLLMFGWQGDPLWIHNLPLRPPVSWLPALFFWIGVLWAWRNPAPRAILLALGILLWPGILAVSNSPAPPDHLRVIAVAPLAFLLAAYGLTRVTQFAPLLFAALAVGVILLDGGISWRDYQRWGAARESYEQLDADIPVLAREIAQTPTTFFVIPLASDWKNFTTGHHWTIDYLTHQAQNYQLVSPPYALPAFQADKVALVKWQAGMHLSADPQRRLEGTLKLLGYNQVDSAERRTYLLTHYRRGQQSIQRVAFDQAQRYGEDFQVTALRLYLLQQDNGQKGLLLAEVEWAGRGPQPEGLSISLRLQSANQQTVAQVDSALWNGKGETAEFWASAEQSVLFLETDVAALAAGEYQVVLIPYQTQSQSPLSAPAPASNYQIGPLLLP